MCKLKYERQRRDAKKDDHASSEQRILHACPTETDHIIFYFTYLSVLKRTFYYCVELIIAIIPP